MNKIALTALIASSSLVFTVAQADEAMAKAKGCLACHGINSMIVGPAFKDVAKKYTGQNVADALSQKVIKGGGGVWGGMPMPANTVSPAEAKQLVEWVLSLK